MKIFLGKKAKGMGKKMLHKRTVVLGAMVLSFCAVIAALYARDPVIATARIDVGRVERFTAEGVVREDILEDPRNANEYVHKILLVGERGKKCQVEHVNVGHFAFDVFCRGRTKSEAEVDVRAIADALIERHRGLFEIIEQRYKQGIENIEKRIALLERSLSWLKGLKDPTGLLAAKIVELEQNLASAVESRERSRQIKAPVVMTRINDDGIRFTDRSPDFWGWILALASALFIGLFVNLFLGIGMSAARTIERRRLE